MSVKEPGHRGSGHMQDEGARTVTMDYRVLSYRLDGHAKAGILFQDRVFEATALCELPAHFGVIDLLRQWDHCRETIPQRLATRAAGRDAIPLSRVELLAPILYPGQIHIAGSNYEDHVQEMAERRIALGEAGHIERFETPWHILKGSGPCVVGHRELVRRPVGCQRLDWEAELAVVIGRPARSVSTQDALDHVAG